MKKFAMSFIGGLLFVAGYFHVHHAVPVVDTQKAPMVSQAPVALFSLKTLPAFAFRNEKYFAF